jgi:hypothetical protein
MKYKPTQVPALLDTSFRKTGRPVRPECNASLWQRIKQAWFVLVGRYDSLDWGNGDA